MNLPAAPEWLCRWFLLERASGEAWRVDRSDARELSKFRLNSKLDGVMLLPRPYLVNPFSTPSP